MIPSGRASVVAACALLAASVAPAVARAELSAEIPEECGTRAELQGQLENRLGTGTSLDTTRVTLSAEPGGYFLRVEVAAEQRELHDPSCRELLRAAVVIAVALLEPPRRAEPEPAPLSPIAPIASVVPERVREPERQRARLPFDIALAPTVGVHFGTTPRPTIVLELDAQLRWSHWGVATGARYLLPTSERDDTERGVEVSGLGAYLAGSYSPIPRLQARLGVVGYRLSGTGLGSVQRASDVTWEVAPTVGASFVPFEYGVFWTALGGEAQLNLLRARFEIREYGEVFRVAPVSAQVFGRAGLTF